MSTGRRPLDKCTTQWRDYISQQVWEPLSGPPEGLEEVVTEKASLGMVGWVDGSTTNIFRRK